MLEKRRWSKRLIRFFRKIMADNDLYVGENGDEMLDFSILEENDDSEEGYADEELFFQAVHLKMYRAELEVYRQAR